MFLSFSQYHDRCQWWRGTYVSIAHEFTPGFERVRVAIFSFRCSILSSIVCFFIHFVLSVHLLCIYFFYIFINRWMFKEGYIAAIRSLGLSRFRFAIYRQFSLILLYCIKRQKDWTTGYSNFKAYKL
jgi:hypothetical protein